jgi:hypothetical protein
MIVAEASKVLGISESAVRKRVERGRLKHEHTPDGRLIVYRDITATTRDHVRNESRDLRVTTATERYVGSLEDQVKYLRRQPDQERDANRENRRIIAALTARILELPSASETSNSSETPFLSNFVEVVENSSPPIICSSAVAMAATVGKEGGCLT